ncbi:splicing factor 3A subunit 1-like [Paramacrobiotus metropolitanus]|uniref:splicing factor 3A subunit 1-like n=1 Tax=Paramacrobiotus metropolitanus TaxID=2943436 RepID=UPI00244606AE|nr:splicing factor 3A subunit 1-like [Paramacrobiotus metropolitanus]
MVANEVEEILEDASKKAEFVLRPDIRDDQNEGEVYNTPVIGIIYPPPELRNIVDKTASFVARNGVEFESRIRQTEANNPKFNFLNPGDPYHAYYEHKVGEFIQGKGQEPQVVARPSTPPLLTSANVVQEKIRQQVKTLVTLKDPPPEFEFFADPPSISSFDLEVVKLTAQCVAKNGKEFLSELMEKEKSNFQFDFLKPQHSLFDYFTRLVEQYTKVLLPPKTIVRDLRQEVQDPRKVLNAARYRAEWYRREMREKEREEEEHERERVAYAQIDWHDFTVVETIDYQPWEEGEFPAPTTPEEVGARSLLYERMLQEQQLKQQAPPAANTDAEDITVEMEIEEEEPRPESPRREEPKETPAPSLPPPVINPAIPGNVIIRPYNPKQKPTRDTGPPSTEFVISPITGERIPVTKLQEHLKYSLLDPEFLQQRDRQLQDKQQQELVYAPGTAIGESLRQLAERRTDIFGSGAEETSIGRKIGDASKEPDRNKVIWDGFSASSEATVKTAAKTVTPEEQRKHDYEMAKIQGLIPDPEKDKIGPQTIIPPPVRAPPPFMSPAPPVPTLRPPVMGMSFLPPPAQVMFQPPPVMPPRMVAPPPVEAVAPPVDDDEDDDEPASKRQKQDHTAEEEFLKTYKNPITFKVQVPHVADKPEWKLNGQVLNLTLAPKDTFTTIKARIQDQLGIPQGKQKLQFDGVYVKDTQSLASCNIIPGSMVILQLKERGGRKK